MALGPPELMLRDVLRVVVVTTRLCNEGTSENGD